MESTQSRTTENCNSSCVLILGGSGFIGTRLTSILRNQELQVRIGDLRESEAFPDLRSKCDVRRLEDVCALADGAGVIVNLAAEHRDDVSPRSRYYETNVEGAQQVCTAARRNGVKKIIFTSSVAVYGFPPEPLDEDGSFAPFNDYGKTKLEAEQVYRAWAAEDSARTLVVVRPTVVFGEGNRGNVYNLLKQIASGRFLLVGSGNNIKSIAYVGNVAAFLAHALSMDAGVHTFNYVDKPDMSTKELIAIIRKSLRIPESAIAIPKPLALAVGLVFDVIAGVTGRSFPISAIRVRKFCETTQFLSSRVAGTGFVAPFSLAEGLARTIQFDFPQGPRNL